MYTQQKQQPNGNLGLFSNGWVSIQCLPIAGLLGELRWRMWPMPGYSESALPISGIDEHGQSVERTGSSMLVS